MIATRQRLRDVAVTSQFVANRNRRRALITLGILAVILVVFGARAVIAGITGFLVSAPFLAIQLGLGLAFGIVQFFGIMWFLSRPRKYTIKPDDPQIGMTFDNYRGQPDLLAHASSTVGILQGVKAFEQRGGEMPKGMLLSGSPGTGKTFLAAVIASEANLPFIYIDASSLRGMFIGMTEMMVMKLFRDARGLARKYARPGERGACIVFMDEIDSIGMNRGGQQGGGMMMGGMMMGGGTGLNTLLNQMDSLGDHIEDRFRYKVLRWFGLVRGPVRNKPLVFVIGATNRPAVLDAALTRPGRLDRILEVHKPDADGRRDIIAHYLSSKAHDPEMPMELLVNDSMGWTPIMIKTIINEALIHAHDDGRDQLDYKDWLNAADERSLGIKQPIRAWNLTDRRETAYHEAGHAVVARYLRPEHRDLQGDDHPPRPCAGLRPAAPAGGTDLAVRAVHRDADDGLAGRARRRGQVPRFVDDGPLERSPVGHPRGAGLRGLARDGSYQARAAGAGRTDAAGSGDGRGPRDARPAVRGDGAPAPRKGTGHPSPRQGAHGSRRADRRGARGSLRGGRGAVPAPDPEVRTQAHPVPVLRAPRRCGCGLGCAGISAGPGAAARGTDGR